MLLSEGSVKTRREFIKQSALATGMFTLLGACGRHKLLNSPLDSDAISKFRESFSGHIILPGDTEYEMARRARWLNPETDKHPVIIGQCMNEEDVLRCVDFVHQHELEVAVRSGNHSFLGWGTCDRGMVIDLSKMKRIAVDPVRQTVVVTTGNTSEEILAATAQYGLAPVLGECGSVGAGLTLGGGLGWLSGKYGATCDNLISARVITADGRTMKTDASTNADLFWAIRGGGGNFGVATSFEYRLHTVSEMLAGGFGYPVSKARAMLRFFREFMSTAPDELQALAYLTSHGKGRLTVVFVYLSDLSEGEKLLNTFRKFSTPDQDWVKRRPYSEVYNMSPDDDNDKTIPCPFHVLKGSYIEQLSDDVIDLVIDRFSNPPPACELGFDFDHYMHGGVCRVAPDSTAFELRKPGAVHLAFGVEWKNTANESACMTWHTETLNKLQQYSGGRMYSNYMGIEGVSAVKSVYGANYPRLAQLKKKYDPQNFFHRNQNILPK